MRTELLQHATFDELYSAWQRGHITEAQFYAERDRRRDLERQQQHEQQRAERAALEARLTARAAAVNPAASRLAGKGILPGPAVTDWSAFGKLPVLVRELSDEGQRAYADIVQGLARR